MKTCLTLFALAAFSGAAHAQLQKGDWMVGGTGGAAFGSSANGHALGVGLRPRAGYFITDRFVAGAEIGLNYGRYRFNADRQQTFAAGVSPFARYYFVKSAAHREESPRLAPFVEIGGGIERYWTKTSNFNGTSAYAAVGANYFLNPNVALEAGLYYAPSFTRREDAFIRQPLSLRFGFQIFLGGRTRSVSSATEMRQP